MRMCTRTLFLILALALTTRWVCAQEAPRGPMVEVAIPQVEDLDVYPFAGAVIGGQSYWVGRIGGDTERQALFLVTKKGLEPVLLGGTTPVRGNALSLMPHSPYILRKQGQSLDYLLLNGAKATTVAFGGEFRAGTSGQQFCTHAPELLWDPVTQALHHIRDSKAVKIDQRDLAGVVALDACKVPEGFLLVEVAVAASTTPKAWLLDRQFKLQRLSFTEVAEMNTLLMFRTGGTPYLLAGTPGSGTFFTLQGSKLAKVVDGANEPVAGVPWLSVAAPDVALYCTRDTGDDSLELWMFHDPRNMSRVTDRQGNTLGEVRFTMQSQSEHSAIVRDASSPERVWFVNGSRAVALVDRIGQPFSKFDEALVREGKALLLQTDSPKELVSLYQVYTDGAVHPVLLPNGQLAVANIGIKRVPGGAGILEGMEIVGDGKLNYCRRWTDGGCRLYVLTP